MSEPPPRSPIRSDEVKPRPRSERMVTLLRDSNARVELYLILLVLAAAVITAHRIL